MTKAKSTPNTPSRVPPAARKGIPKAPGPSGKAPEAPEDASLTTGERIPPAPDYLGKHGQNAYARTVDILRKLGVEDAADAQAVEALAGAYEDYRGAREVIDADGFTYETFTKDGELRVLKRPEAEVMAEAWKRMAGLMSQLCLTTAARRKGKMAKGKSQDEDPWAAFVAAPTTN